MLCVPFLIFFWVQVIQSSRILVIIPTASLSHNLFFRPLFQGLSTKGHKITLITGDPMNVRHIREIDVRNETYGILNSGAILLKQGTTFRVTSSKDTIEAWMPTLMKTFDAVLGNPQVQKLLKTESFDIVLSEYLFHATFYPLKQHFNCPMVGLFSMGLTFNAAEALGNGIYPSYFVDWLHANAGVDLSFTQRLSNVLSLIQSRWYYRNTLIPEMEKITLRHFGKKYDLLEAEKTFDLVLINSNPIFNPARPLVPAIIEIGGLHLRKRKPLPKDLKTLLDEAKEGAIYLSLGSNIKSSSLPPDVFNSLIEAFAKLPYKVFWKWEDSHLTNKPANVYIQPWFPQQDVLDHPNIKAFVTQGGLQSIEEAIRSKVPMVCIPFGADQEYNANRIRSLQIGIKLDFDALTSDNLVAKVMEVSTKPVFKERVGKVSDLLWDQPLTPLDRGVWWIEYLIRHKSADHLRSPAVNMSWFILLSLDVLAFFLLVTLLIVLIILYLIKKLFCIKNAVKIKRN